MTKEEIFHFLRENPFFSLATTDSGTPHVRTLMLHKADDSGIYFMTAKFKDLYRQLALNPDVELCFHRENFQVRVHGVVENLDRDKVLKEEIAETRPFIRPWIEKFGYKYMAVFRLKDGLAVTWSLETEFEKSVPVAL
jgi:uncharacterized pyridoxamine 5'-phosphate oxidase family protein